MRETRKKWQHSVINAMTSVRTRNRKWSCVGSGRGLIYLEWSEEIAQAVVSELDFEESVVILMVKNSGLHSGKKEWYIQSQRAMSRSNWRLLTYKGRGCGDLPWWSGRWHRREHLWNENPETLVYWDLQKQPDSFPLPFENPLIFIHLHCTYQTENATKYYRQMYFFSK